MIDRKFYRHVEKLLIISMLSLVGNAFGQGAKIETYVPPKVTKTTNPYYPNRPEQLGIEGSVELNMMVDTDGKPFEVAVVNSTGSKEFEASALSVLRKWKFEPAKSEGKPIIGSTKVLMRFLIGGPVHASKEFIDAYKEFFDGIKSQPKEDAAALLEKLKASGGNNRYEAAFLSLANYLYANKYGNSLEQMKYLDAALSFSRDKNDPVFLPVDEAIFARRELLKLQVKNAYYQEALGTYGYFAQVGDKDSMFTFNSTVNQIIDIAKSEKSYEIPMALDEGGHATIKLLKHKVYATEVAGKLDEFKLYCQKKFVGFPVEADFGYDIPEAWGLCSLDVIGRAGTKFKIGQQ